MTSRILNPKEIETATVRMQCGNKSGTAFFVFVSNDKQILLTSEHNLPENNPVMVFIADQKVEASILDRIPDRDVAILSTHYNDITGINPLPLKNIQIPYNENWETYGFPAERVNSGGKYNGTVSRSNEGTSWDVDLECAQYNNLSQFDGLSGSALIIDGYAVGIIGYDNAGTLGATSIQNVEEQLLKHQIVVLVDKKGAIPDSIEEDISNTSPNNEVLSRINQLISDKINSSHFLISGSPGSGKTTIAAQLELDAKNYIILDRFFVKVPESEEYPTKIRATSEFFLKWVEEVCYRALHNSPPPKPKSETTLNERILFIQQIITQISTNYQQHKKIAFLIIDGLDDVKNENREDYLSLLPLNLPPNFKVIFSCVSKTTLPATIQSIIKSENEIRVTPLTISNTEQFLKEQLSEKQLTSAQINNLAQKSEGHPLYLRYLIKYILDTDLTSLNDWISSIPSIGGEIENYYSKIWQQIDDQTEEVWLAATLSRLRVPVDNEILIKLLPASTQHHFITSFKKIQHLLRDIDSISIYHTSFSDFINEKTNDINVQVHKNIALFVLNHHSTQFGISERVYHLANGDEESKKRVLDECNQTWVDDCALNSVNPDIVLADIKDIIGLAAELGISHKVISLLLLSQRVNFRYNTLFQENAIFLVNALLALNKPEEAIKYIVRNKTLTTSDGDALYLLQRFYEYEAIEEADILLSTISQTCRNLVESGLDRYSFDRFTQLKFGSVTLSANSDFEEAFHTFGHYKKQVVKIIEANKNPEEVVHGFMDTIGSYNTGYFIWRFNMPPVTKQTEDKFSFNDKSSGFIAHSIHQALEFQEKSPKRKMDDNIPAWIEDLEYVIDKYGINPNYHFILLYVLVGRSKRADIIEKLYKLVYSNEENFQFREDNGVDLNYQAIHRFTLCWECLGYLDTSNIFPELSKYGYKNNWENNIKSIFQYLSFLSGKVKRSQIDNKPDEISSFDPNISSLLNAIIPDLRIRINWNRSYALPELIYPLIYKNLIRLMVKAFPDKIPLFTESISQKSHYQLGLYTEGYVDSLFVIARELAKRGDQDLAAFQVAKTIEEHIIGIVENRWERNEYLLNLVELYALIKNKDKAENVFKEMINTSMGPSWYKEAQLGIINTVISNIIPKDGNETYLQKFAAHLHNASGEMTFQRYVKQQQEEFVGDLAQVGFLHKSISYFKYLLLPNYPTVIENAESGKVDMPFIGSGYVLGAKAIDEQNGILSMLASIDCKGSLIAFGLSELFILGDDRYIRGYAKIQAEILNYIENNNTETLEILLKRLVRHTITEVCDEHRTEYLREIFNELSLTNFDKFIEQLELVGMSPSKSDRKSENYVKETSSGSIVEDDPLDKLISAKLEAQKSLDLENKSAARKIIIDALEEVQIQKHGIWSSMYSSKINDLRKLLLKSYNNSSELIKGINNLIIKEPYFEEWVIASEIIGLLRNIEDEEEKQHILSSVLEHIELMVRTSKSFYDKYNWLGSSSDRTINDEQDKLLLELLIWFLNHPSIIIKNRTIEILTWLGTINPEIISQALINEITREGYKISKELSASIIHQISNLNPPRFSDALAMAIHQNEDELLGIKHFMIKNSLLDSLKQLKFNGVIDLDDLISKFEQTFITSNKTTQDIIVDHEFLEPINSQLYDLNDLGILTKEFADELLNLVKTSCVLDIKESEKASSYIDRSFNDHNDITLISDFDTILKYSLNVAISSSVTLSNKEKVADILRFYQPTFSENKLQVQIKDGEEILESVIKDLFKNDTLDFEKVLINREIPLNYFSTRYIESNKRKYEIIEFTSYLIPLDKYNGKEHSYSWPVFSANSFPNNIEYDDEYDDENVIPVFIKSGCIDDITGSDLIPSIINPKINTLIPGFENSTKSVYWRRGRNWNNQRLGIPERTGYYTTISDSIINDLKSNYKLVWQIYLGHDFKYIDVFEQIEIK